MQMPFQVLSHCFTQEETESEGRRDLAKTVQWGSGPDPKSPPAEAGGISSMSHLLGEQFPTRRYTKKAEE